MNVKATGDKLMATTLEERVAKLEKQMASVLGEETEQIKPIPWWESMFGMFADSENFEEAVRAGREYREAQRETEQEEAECA